MARKNVTPAPTSLDHEALARGLGTLNEGPGYSRLTIDGTTIAYLKKGVVAVPAGAVKDAPRRLVRDLRPEKSGRWVNVRGLDNASARALLEHVVAKGGAS